LESGLLQLIEVKPEQHPGTFGTMAPDCPSCKQGNFVVVVIIVIVVGTTVDVVGLR
jgi:hypothetical protein